MKTNCVARYPDMKSEIDAKFSTWRFIEAHAIAKVEEKWPAMVLQEPKFEQMLAVMESSLKNALKSFEKMPADVGEEMYRGTCRKHFIDLASGVWRKRTPNTYRYLDEMK